MDAHSTLSYFSLYLKFFVVKILKAYTVFKEEVVMPL